jgi:alanine dehydrogenase
MAALVVGVPKEIKDKENRVSVLPDGVAELSHYGHRVVVQAGAGAGCGFSDAEYEAAGAEVVDTPEAVFAAADLIVKVKEPIPEEYERFRPGQQLFTYLHLAADRRLTEFLLERRIDSIAYETVQTADGRLPLLTPMSEVAGRMSVQAAAHHLESSAGGAGLLRGGVPGTPAAKVTIIGGSVSGTEAAKMALGLRAIVRVLDTNPTRLSYLSDVFGGRLDLVVPNRARTAAYVADSDVVIGAVLVAGAKAPKVVTREMIASMRPGSVVVDIAIDQGGCFETSRPTTHSEPHLCRGGCDPLLRGQHSRRSRADVDPRANQRHLPLPGPGRRERSGRGRCGRPGTGQGADHPRRPAGLPTGGPGARPAVQGPGRRAADGPAGQQGALGNPGACLGHGLGDSKGQQRVQADSRDLASTSANAQEQQYS